MGINLSKSLVLKKKHLLTLLHYLAILVCSYIKVEIVLNKLGNQRTYLRSAKLGFSLVCLRCDNNLRDFLRRTALKLTLFC